ncbi:DUF11 domain-containing protein [Spirosoma sp. KCTC 42546]|uniref:Ig-like domain-containing protein n=1 Tax=Spirosoma sp. KCTC 42546 TaxID=2520506 RepID=UPI0011591651|nr:putative Ig domain-containing protein [Spirosoma sp. KCTC 42546]QDK82151.1 DUF11 domain-containing protein [Spirosoma sp. KCTC 42546]
MIYLYKNSGKAAWAACLTVILLLLCSGLYAQQMATCSTPGIIAKWNFDSNTAQCNGGRDNPEPTGGYVNPTLSNGATTYCPQLNVGCGTGLLGSRGHQNTPQYKYAICLFNFYDSHNPLLANFKAAPFDPASTVWDPLALVNVYAEYTFPVGNVGCLSNFSLNILQKQFSGTQAGVNFETQGVAVFRNGVQIYSSTQPILAANINGTPMTFNFTGADFCTDGSKAVTYRVYFGLVHQLNAPGVPGTPAQTGYDNICLNGICGSVKGKAVATSATCQTGTPLSNGTITLSDYDSGTKFDFSVGSTYTGGKTYATASSIPAGGVIANNLPNPSGPLQEYTIRVFNATGCAYDINVTLYNTTCPSFCNQPSGAVVTLNPPTCSGTTPANNGQIAVTGVTGGDKIGISVGGVYTGPAYAAANALNGGAYTFTGLSNPAGGSQLYTIRIFNATDGCYVDRVVELEGDDCAACKKGKSEIWNSSLGDPNSTPANDVAGEDDLAIAEFCLSSKKINLSLTKSVNPNTGTTCTGTTFTWTLTLTNSGDMDATDIQVADLIPDGLEFIGATPSSGVYYKTTGWILSSLGAGQSATVSITTFAQKAGTFINCAEVVSALPLNDPNSTPGNQVTTEDDYACATITVTGASPPIIEKEFSSMLTKPGTPTRLTLKIRNNESTPVTLTSDFVDTFPTSPGAMVVASTPKIATSGLVIPASAVVATAGGNTLTLPKGTVLAPGLNLISLEVTVPSEGSYCNTIAAGSLKTTVGENCLAATGCLLASNTFNLAPRVKKTMTPATIQTGQNATLTITIENLNGSAMTLNQDFVDYLPTNLVATGTPTSTCGGVSLQNTNKELKLAGGTSIAANSICTITVPVTSNVAGTYCNVLPMNGVLTTVGTNNNLGNEDIAEACVTVTNTPCTAVGTVSVTQNPATTIVPGSDVSLTAVATGFGANSIVQWSSVNGSFSNVGINPTVWTAPATEGTYTIKTVINNAATGYGTCKDSTTTTITVAFPCTAPTPTGVPAARCGAGTVTLSASGCDATHPAVWFSDAALTTQVGTGDSFTTPGLTTTTTYYVACVKDATCKSAGVAVEATINALPTVTSAVATPATCTIDGTAANSDAQLSLSGFDPADQYDYNEGTTYTGSATYATATAIPADGVLVSNLANPAAATTYTIRVFNAAGCFIDVQATLQPTTCTPTCTPPTPTGAPAASCGTGTVTLSASGCDATYPTVWYSDAALTTQVGTGDSFTTPGLTTTTTYYVACVKDATCQSAGVAVEATINALPTVASAVATPATCNAAGTAANNDAQLSLSGFDPADQYDYNEGATYTGSATYATATAIPVSGILVSNLANPAAATTYTIRVFNAAGCFVDLQAVLQPTTCTPNCTPPTPIGVAAARCGTGTVTLTATGCDATYPAVWFSDAALATQVGTGDSFTTPGLTTTTTYYVACVKDATCQSAGVSVVATVNALPTVASAVATAATCNAAGTAANADGGLTLAGFGATDKYDYNLGATYTGSATYATATAIPAGGVLVSNLANPAAATTYTIRVFNAAGCFVDLQAVLQPTTCTPNCTPPTPIGVAAARCGTGTVTLTATGCDATYPAVWFSDAALATQVGTGNSFTTPAITATTTYYVACVKDATCKSAGVSVVATVNALPILSLSASSTSVTVGTPVSLSAIGCTGSVVWSTGETGASISVTPTNATTVYSATCTTGPGCTATASITLNTTAACSVSLTTNSLPVGTVGQAYSANLTVSGGTAPYSFLLAGGTLPTGLTLSSTGLISGIPTATGTFSTTIRISDSQSCSVTVPLAVLNIELAPTCSLTISATPGSCQSATNTYSVSGTLSLTNNTNGGTIQLSDGTQLISLSVASGVSSVPYSLTGLVSDGLVHTLTATLSGCGTASVSYTAPQSCMAASLVVVSATVCYGSSATLVASGCTGSVSWNTGATGTTLVTPALTASTSYTATCTTGTGSTTTAVGTVTVMPQAILSLSASSTSVTVGTPVSLSAIGCTGSVVWSTGETGASISVIPTNATTVYSATCTTGPGCTATASITLNTAPAASLVVVSATVCYGSSATLVASGCTGSVSWNTGATGTTLVTPVLTASTSYTATCTTGTGSTTTAVGTVTVMPQAILSLSASSTSVTVGTPVSLSAIGCTGSVVWSTGETGASISVIPTNATTVYSATCTTGPGCTATASITLNTAPAASLVVVSATVCYGSSATLVASGCTGSVSWNTGATGTTLVTPVLTASTSYTATCTTGTGSTTTAVGTVTVMPQAILSLSASSTSVTVGTPVSLSAIGCTGSVVWSTGATTSVISVIPTNATTVYSATCTTGPGCTATASITVNTTAACSVSLTTNSLPVGTVGQAYSANLTVSGGTAPYSFLLAGGTLPTGLTLSSTGLISGIPTATGTFSTTIRISDSQSCSVTVPLAVLNIELAPVCSLTISATPGSCQSASNTYSVSGTLSLTNNTNGGTIQLSDGTQLISLSVASGVSSVPYSLTGLISDGLVHTLTATLSGCGTASVSYTAPQSCTAACPPPVHACKGTNYAFVLTTTPGMGTYQWYRNGSAISGATGSSFTATQAGSYSVVVNGNVVGQCPDGSCCPVVIVEDEVPLYQANVQTPTCSGNTPNADGRILVSGWKLSNNDATTYTYSISLGSSFNASQIVAGGANQVVPASGVLVTTLPNPSTSAGQSYTIRIQTGEGCYRDVVVNLPQTQCACPPAKCVPFVIKRVK